MSLPRQHQCTSQRQVHRLVQRTLLFVAEITFGEQIFHIPNIEAFGKLSSDELQHSVQKVW